MVYILNIHHKILSAAHSAGGGDTGFRAILTPGLLGNRAVEITWTLLSIPP